MEIPLWQRKGKPELKLQAVMLTENNTDEVANWTQAQIVIEQHPISGEESEGLNVKTPHGKERASRDDYIVCVGGNFHVVKRGAFEMQYSPVTTMVDGELKVASTKREFSDPFEGMNRA